MNVMLVALKDQSESHQDLRRLTQTRGKPTLDSGNYRHGFVVTERMKIPAGEYTLIVSPFNPGQVGAFQVKVCSSLCLSINSVN